MYRRFVLSVDLFSDLTIQWLFFITWRTFHLFILQIVLGRSELQASLLLRLGHYYIKEGCLNTNADTETVDLITEPATK